jgi:hypothetical protein
VVAGCTQSSSGVGRGVDYGTLLSIVLYVFEFSGTIALLPDAWQQYLRVRDIVARLRSPGTITN